MKTIIIGIIIILILILAIIIAIFIGITQIKHKVEHTSQELFGTSDITEAAQMLREENATTPKSVSGMTNLLLPQICTDFPDFDYNEMKDRSNNVLTSYLRGITENNPSVLKDADSELKNQLENYIQNLSNKDQRERFDLVHLHQTEIHRYRKSQGRCIITFQTSLECLHTIKDKTGEIISGSSEYKYQTKFNVDMIYIQDRSLVEKEGDNALGINCPNCGAPIKGLGAKFCEFCGSPIVELNIKAWNFSDVEEIHN